MSAHLKRLGMNRRFDWPACFQVFSNRPDKSPWNETYTAAQSASVSKISATPQPLRPLRFQKRTFTAPIIMEFDTFNQA
jgi:hypothetical protein